MPGPASRLLSQNIVNLIELMTGDDAALVPDFDDEIIVGTCVTHAGDVRHQPTRELLDGPDEEGIEHG